MAEWISVKDKLPEEGGQYLVFVKEEDEEHGCVLNAWFNPFELTLVPLEIGWTLLYEFYEFSDRLRGCITHWMPLPEPPREEE